MQQNNSNNNRISNSKTKNSKTSINIHRFNDEATVCIRYMNALEEAYQAAKHNPSIDTKNVFMREYEYLSNIINGLACDTRYDRLIANFNDMMGVGYLWSDEEKAQFQNNVVDPMMEAKRNWEKYTLFYKELERDHDLEVLNMRSSEEKVNVGVNVGGGFFKKKPEKDTAEWVSFRGQKRKVFYQDGKKYITFQGRQIALGTIRGQYEYVTSTDKSQPKRSKVLKGGCGCSQGLHL